MWLPEVLFWGSLASVFYTYKGYSWLLKILPAEKIAELAECEEWPKVEVIFAAHNEEVVIASKLQSLIQTTYPAKLLTVTVGSDASTDRTDEIVEEFSKKNGISIRLVRFEQRTGKAGIINKLAADSTADILVCTDANVLHEADSIKKAVALLTSQPTLGAVGGTLHFVVKSAHGIALQENYYRTWENTVRHRESALWQLPMGLEGGFYAIRKELFKQIPKNFYMEDFFQTLHLYCNGFKAYLHPEVIGYEDVSTIPEEEFQRKKRISIGNFQNFFHFFRCIHSNAHLAFVFWSHKGLRWITPVLFLLALASNLLLVIFTTKKLYSVTLLMAVLFLLFSLLGRIFSKKKQKFAVAVFIYHFVNMNFALLTGLIQYIKGVKSNVWQPTRRNQA
ncbi:MAG: glycosyltransferase [Thermaurantimonas sp.]|uniref:glycosyltransferase n=1 Tax=Thermaurantimonas sp. TaxID=2681568 RepID=UPI00391CAC06